MKTPSTSPLSVDLMTTNEWGDNVGVGVGPGVIVGVGVSVGAGVDAVQPLAQIITKTNVMRNKVAFFIPYLLSIML